MVPYENISTHVILVIFVILVPNIVMRSQKLYKTILILISKGVSMIKSSTRLSQVLLNHVNN